MFVILREDEKPDRIEAAATTIYQLDSRKGFLRVLKAPFIGPLFLPLPEALQHMLEKLADESPEKQNEFLADRLVSDKLVSDQPIKAASIYSGGSRVSKLGPGFSR